MYNYVSSTTTKEKRKNIFLSSNLYLQCVSLVEAWLSLLSEFGESCIEVTLVCKSMHKNGNAQFK